MFAVETWTNATKLNPCPLCGKPDWCSIEESGDAVLCRRLDMPPIGWRRIKNSKDGYPIFAREGKPSSRNNKIININHSRSRAAKPKRVPLPEAIELAKGHVEPAVVTKNQRFDGLTSIETRFNYGDDKWVIRHERTDANGQRIGKKWYSQHHSIDGIEQFKEKSEDGILKKVPFKGDAFWPAYREAEADLALQNGGNCLLVVEGEPCTEAAWELGFAAITFQGSGWSFHEGIEGYIALKCLRAEGLVIWPDNDRTGMDKAKKLAEACAGLGIWTVQLDPAAFDLPEKGDIVDAIASLGGDEVQRRIEQQLQEIIANYQPEPELEFGGDGGGGDGGCKKAKLPPADIIAEEIAEEYRDRLVYNNENGTWYRHEADAPGVWSAESAEYIESIVNGILRGKGYSGWGENSYITNVIKALRHVLIERKWVERPANELLPFQNGVLELATGKLLPHSPGYRFTWCMPRPHNPLATDWTRISNWMDTALNGNTHLKNVLIAFANAVLRGRSDLQKVLHLIGIGGSGKGTFLRLLVALIGEENCYSTTLEEWCGNRFEAAQAYRKRLVQFPDEDKGVKGLGRFKSLTGGDFLRGEEKNKKPFQFRFDGMVVMVSNFPIFSSDNSSGISRRMITVPFNNMVEESQRRDLDKEFQPELAAFTNYLLNLSDDWVERVLRGVADVPEISLQFWENKIREDSIAGFFNDRLIVDPSAQTAVGNGVDAEGSLYQAYVTYCKDQGQCPKAVKNFSPDLLELCGPTLGLKSIDRVHTKTGKFIKGVRLRTGADNHIGTWDFELREKCKLLGDGCGDGLVTGAVTGQNPDSASVLDMVKDKTTIGCEKIELKSAAETNQHLDLQLSSQPDIENHPSPIANNPSGKGFDPSPAIVTDASPHPSPSEPSEPIATSAPAVESPADRKARLRVAKTELKIGDRVKITRAASPGSPLANRLAQSRYAFIVAIEGDRYQVRFDGSSSPWGAFFGSGDLEIHRPMVAEQLPLIE